MNFLKKYCIVILLISLVIFHLISNIIWIIQDQSPPLWDMAGHSERSIKIFELLNPPSLAKLRVIGGYQSIYPPFVYFVTSIFYFIFGVKEDIPNFSNLVFVIILLLSTFGIGKKLYNDKIGLLSTFFISIYTLTVHFSRIYDLDYQLAAMVTLTIFLLLKTEYFSRRKYSVLLGIVIVFGLLTKWTFLFFVAGPVLVILWRALVSKKIYQYRVEKIKPLINFTITLLITLVFSIPWYFKHYKLIFNIADQARNNIFSVPYENLFSLNNIFYYFSRLYQSIYLIFFILFILGLIHIIISKKFRNLSLLLWFFIPYAIMTFLFSKESRYFLPAYPMVAVSSAVFLVSLKYKNLKSILIIFFILFGLYYFVETSWNIRLLNNISFLKPILFTGYGYILPTSESPRYGYTYPIKLDSKIKETIDVIQQSKKDDKIILKVAIIPNDIFFNSQQFIYYTALKKNKIDYSPSSTIRNPSYEQNLKEADFIVTKTGSQGPEIWAKYSKEITDMENDPVNQTFHIIYGLIKSIEREDSSTIKIYQKINE